MHSVACNNVSTYVKFLSGNKGKDYTCETYMWQEKKVKVRIINMV